MKRTCLILCAIAILALGSVADAGILCARRPNTESPVYNLAISHIRTTVTIAGQLAITHVDEEFYNSNNLTLEGFYAFQLPDGAKVDGLWLWENGVRRKFVCMKKEDAERKYDSVVIGTRRDPALLESLGANRFQLKVFPIAPYSSRRIEIQYFYTLPLTPDGFIHYTYPLNMSGYQSVPVQTTEMTFNVISKIRILALSTNFDGQPLLNRVNRQDDYTYTIHFGLENQNYTQDFTIAYRQENIFNIIPVLSWKDPAAPSDDPYFIAWHPLSDDSSGNGVSRDFVFVLDASGSMVGSRITAVKTAVKSIISKLRESDRFRIVLFSSNAISNPSDRSMLFATSENISLAQQFIDQNYEASGGTNFEAAFSSALDADYRPEADKRMLFLTDGVPSQGISTSQELINLISYKDKYGVRIFPVIFYSAALQLLTDIVNARGGKLTNVETTDNLETVISRILLDMEIAGFMNASVKYNLGKAYLVYPTSFPPTTSSDQLVTCGRYTGDGRENVTQQYLSSTGQRIVNRDVDFNAGLVGYPEIAAYWGGKRIDALLADISKYGETPELKTSVINLSIKHQILSPYTAFLVLENNPIDPPTGVEATGTVVVSFSLQSVYPNPVHGLSSRQAEIAYTVGKTSLVEIVITDILGRVVRRVKSDVHAPGSYTVRWDLFDAYNHAVPPGIYFIRMTAGTFTQTRKINVVQ